MPDPLKIAVFAEAKGARLYLEDIVRLLGHNPEGSDPNGPSLRLEGQVLSIFGAADDSGTAMTLPVKAAALVSAIRSRLNRPVTAERLIPIGTYTLDTYNSLLIGGEEGRDLRLTEKEVAILVCLHKAGGTIVGRQTLLDTVWGYAQDVETHTLETHIYRLRQKIEKDPANPSIIKTEEDGYTLGL